MQTDLNGKVFFELKYEPSKKIIQEMKRHICASTDTCAVFISLFVENEQTDKHIIGSIWFSFRGFRDAFSYLVHSLNVSFSIDVRQVNISFALACPAEDVFYLVLLFGDLPFPQR